MKLLYCMNCQDIFKLQIKLRTCKCKRVTGKYYPDEHTAVTNGKGYSIAIGNGSLWKAINTKGKKDIMCWSRPNSGPLNPRTEVKDKL